jgi:exopolyphosphatase/guanosine-5'-triphosphate,3'-diphosphate pyrophosphatase
MEQAIQEAIIKAKAMQDQTAPTTSVNLTHKDLTTLKPKGEYYAAVDLGSNSFHLVVVHVIDGNVQVVSRVKQKVRLAAGLDASNHLDELAMERGWQCLATFADRLKTIPAENIKIVATATLRLATNAHDFVVKAESILSKKLLIISGEEEAAEIYRGVAYTSTTSGNTLVIDIGGASTEVIVGRDMQPLHLHSFNMGCVTYMQHYFVDGIINQQHFTNAIAAAKEQIDTHAHAFKCFDWQQALGASGTPQAITDILMHKGIRDEIKLNYLYTLRDQCIAATHIDHLVIDGLAESRRIIFPSGLAILIALFESLAINTMNIAGGALREGIIYGMLDNQPLSDRRAQTIYSCILKFHIDEEQAVAVTYTAMHMFNQISDKLKVSSFDGKNMLYTAAMLHEIGLHIEFKNQHLHGGYILKHSDLAGYTKLQKQCIADLVRYHRGDIPKDALNDYPAEVKENLMQLLKILRIAVVLNIKRTQDKHIAQIAYVNINDAASAQSWQLDINQDWLNENKLVATELANETWILHKAKQILKLNKV